LRPAFTLNIFFTSLFHSRSNPDKKGGI